MANVPKDGGEMLIIIDETVKKSEKWLARVVRQKAFQELDYYNTLKLKDIREVRNEKKI